jgi:asparagine synthase (glutamine-hydrolysing)
MCGIVGISSRTEVSRAALAEAVAAIRHRGPDGEGMFIDDTRRTGLGHTRLAIIDLSPTGLQPMASADGRYMMTFNGEIYNFREIRAELLARGVTFRGTSDSEVLLEGFALLGEAILPKLNGIFAFAIHDKATGDIFVARDQLGIKPVYYAETNEGTAFASELKALGHLVRLGRDLDVSAIRKYLTFLWCPGEQTPLKGVKKLAPGSAMILKDGRILRRWRYWTPPSYAPRENWNTRDCARELKALIDTCVDRQMVSDTPIGAFLSGGLDSSAVVAAMRAKSGNVQCFTIDSDAVEEGMAEDLPYARAVAAHLGVDLHEVKVDAHTMCDRVADMVGILDEPLADPACLNVLFISQLAREHGIKVLLSGAGGDDLFSGYRRHTMLALDPLWSAVPGPLRHGLAALAEGQDQGSAMRRRLAKAFGVLKQDGDARVAASFAWGPPGICDRLLSRDLKQAAELDDVFAPMEEVMARMPDAPALEKCLALEQRFFLSDHNLIYTDKMAMAAAVEVRVPLLDLELVQFASEIPVNWKCNRLRPKWILKESQRDVLPASVIDRPKTGFGAPLRKWMKGDMRAMMDELLSRRVVEARGLFDAREVARLREDDANGACDGSYTLLSLACIELWCRGFVDAGAARERGGDALAIGVPG